MPFLLVRERRLVRLNLYNQKIKRAKECSDVQIQLQATTSLGKTFAKVLVRKRLPYHHHYYYDIERSAKIVLLMLEFRRNKKYQIQWHSKRN